MVKKNTSFAGTGVALITPFRKQETIDFSRLATLIDHIIDSGVTYIVALGTTSEAATMSESERAALQSFIVESVNGRVPIMLGLGGNNTRAVVDTVSHANLEGISGLLSVTPYYNKPQQRGLLQHFKSIAEVSPLPLVLYNVPGRTSCNMTAETTLQLAEECPNIVAIKEASGNLNQVMEILRNKPSHFMVLSGDDALTFPMMALGASGVISVLANALPSAVSQMVDLSLKGSFKKAQALHYRLLPLMQAIFDEGNPAGIKALMEAQNLIGGQLRLPLCHASKTLSNKLTTLLAEFEKEEQ